MTINESTVETDIFRKYLSLKLFPLNFNTENVRNRKWRNTYFSLSSIHFV